MARTKRRPIATPAHERKHWVQYQVKKPDSSEWDDVPEVWEDFLHPIMAAIWPVKAGERVSNRQEEMVSTHQIRHGFYPGITGDMRIKFGSRSFEITGIVNPNEANRDLHITAKEII